MPSVRRSRAFTLIELMFVVILVGVLAMIATVAYRKWVRSSYIGEAQNMLGNIRTAEEAFRAENTGYLPSLFAVTVARRGSQATKANASLLADFGGSLKALKKMSRRTYARL